MTSLPPPSRDSEKREELPEDFEAETRRQRTILAREERTWSDYRSGFITQKELWSRVEDAWRDPLQK